MKTKPLILKQNPVKSLKQWKEGFSKLTPLDHSKAKRVANFWGMLGASMACLSLLAQIPYSDTVLSGTTKLGFGLFVGAIGTMQFIEWRKENQKIAGLRKVMKMTGLKV